MTADERFAENDAPRAGCFDPLTAEELAALPCCATCGGIYPLQCPPHVILAHIVRLEAEHD